MIVKAIKKTWMDILILLALITMLFFSSKLCYLLLFADVTVGYIGNPKYEKMAMQIFTILPGSILLILLITTIIVAKRMTRKIKKDVEKRD